MWRDGLRAGLEREWVRQSFAKGQTSYVYLEGNSGIVMGWADSLASQIVEEAGSGEGPGAKLRSLQRSTRPEILGRREVHGVCPRRLLKQGS